MTDPLTTGEIIALIIITIYAISPALLYIGILIMQYKGIEIEIEPESALAVEIQKFRNAGGFD